MLLRFMRASTSNPANKQHAYSFMLIGTIAHANVENAFFARLRAKIWNKKQNTTTKKLLFSFFASVCVCPQTGQRFGNQTNFKRNAFSILLSQWTIFILLFHRYVLCVRVQSTKQYNNKTVSEYFQSFRHPDITIIQHAKRGKSYSCPRVLFLHILLLYCTNASPALFIQFFLSKYYF